MLGYLSLLEFVEETHKQQFQTLYHTYEQKMYAVAMSYLHNHHRAEDAVSSSFFKIIQHFEKIMSLPCTKQEAYIVTIVKNIAVDILRENKRLIPLDEDFHYSDCGDGTENLDGYHQLLELITRLPPIYRTPLELALVLEWSPAEIAKFLNTNENTLRSRLRRGYGFLRKKVQEEWDGYDE